MVATILLATFFRFHFTGEGWDGTTRKIVLGRLDALQIGVLLAIIERHRPHWWRRIKPVGVILFFAFVGSLLAAHFQFSQSHFPIPPVLLFILFPLGSAGVIILLKETSLGRLQPLVEWLSKISYSLYLSHLPIKNGMEALFGHPPFSLSLSWVVMKILTIVLVLVISHLVYRFVEIPLMKMRPKEIG